MDEEEKQYYHKCDKLSKQMALQRFAVIGTSEMSSEQLEKRQRLMKLTNKKRAY